MTELKLPKKTLALWKLRVTVFAVVFCGAFAYFCRVFPWFLPALIVFICLYGAIIFWYLPCLFKTYVIKYINGAVVIESGVFIKVTHIMPFSKMIYTESITSPLARLMGLKALSLKAARSRIIIPELYESDTEKFMRALAEGEQ
ncbi:MAG: hypothetical protein IJO62_02215 [Clostridia bacterium]|nr:hypothetical protein [Clostridia bacterium]